jgi:RND family efflux transporter MFP subunit
VKGRFALRDLALPLLLATATPACRKADAQPAPPPPPAVMVGAVTPKPEAPLVRRGVMAAGARLRLGFDRPGVVARITVETGDFVRKGTLLARLRDGEVAAAMRAATAQTEEANEEYASASRLAETGSLPPRSRTRAEEQLSYAKAQQERATESLRMTVLRAPVDGRVYERIAEPGEALTAGSPVLLLETSSRPVVRLGVNERDLEDLPLRRSVTLRCGDLPPAHGTVSLAAPSPDASDGLYRIEITPAAGEAKRCVLGSDVVVEIDRADARALRVPIDAIVYRRSAPFVFVLDASDGHTRVRQRAVTLGHVEGAEITVQQGLRDGDRVVLEGGEFLLDGEEVRVLP